MMPEDYDRIAECRERLAGLYARDRTLHFFFVLVLERISLFVGHVTTFEAVLVGRHEVFEEWRVVFGKRTRAQAKGEALAVLESKGYTLIGSEELVALYSKPKQ